jgi:hypothetical protein
LVEQNSWLKQCTELSVGGLPLLHNGTRMRAFPTAGRLVILDLFEELIPHLKDVMAVQEKADMECMATE